MIEEADGVMGDIGETVCTRFLGIIHFAARWEFSQGGTLIRPGRYSRGKFSFFGGCVFYGLKTLQREKKAARVTSINEAVP